MNQQIGTTRARLADHRGATVNANLGKVLQGIPLANLAAPRREIAFLPTIL